MENNIFIEYILKCHLILILVCKDEALKLLRKCQNSSDTLPGQFKSKLALNYETLHEVPPSNQNLLSELTATTANNALFEILRNLHPAGNSQFPEGPTCVAILFIVTGKV